MQRQFTLVPKLQLPRSHALRGNAVKERCAASHDQPSCVYTGRSASSTAFPRSAWEREQLANRTEH